MTMTDIISTSEGAMVAVRTSPVCLPKSNVMPNTIEDQDDRQSDQVACGAPIAPRKNPSRTNIDRIFPGSVPMAAIVPISRILS